MPNSASFSKYFSPKYFKKKAQSYVKTSSVLSSVLLNNGVTQWWSFYGTLHFFFKIFFSKIFQKEVQHSAKTLSLLLNNAVTQWWHSRGTLLSFFLNTFSEISWSRSGISQFLFQPNAHKNMFSFELPTVAGSCLFLRKVAQCNANFHFH